MNFDVAKYVGNQIRKYRKIKKMTQKELGEKIGVKHNTISGYESGTNEPEQNTLFTIADILGVSINDLFPPIDTPVSNIIQLPREVRPVPIIGEIACGSPILANENIRGYHYETLDNLPSGRLYYLIAKGDSMEPTIPNGALVLLREQPLVESGEIAAVLVNDDTEATLKRVKIQDNATFLVPDNNKYDPILVSPKNPVRIIGKALRFTVDL
ncbi:LexA family protein [Cohnella massiliensis]|uniref:LexA family protein n=1 Tax=Cohnella massiliensis TaxID=1816691 RepID=UPI0009BB4E18|nr:XRE family transcriptional regulator [Cohnella massiliensis]